MTADILLSKLDRVRKTGRNSWRACCPAHKGANPTSLLVTETDDGMVLVRCHAHECSAEDIAAAVGIDLSDLFPPSINGHSRKPDRMPFNPRDVLAAMQHEALIVLLCANDIRKGKVLTDDAMSRLTQAVGRISSSVEVCRAS